MFIQTSLSQCTNKHQIQYNLPILLADIGRQHDIPNSCLMFDYNVIIDLPICLYEEARQEDNLDLIEQEYPRDGFAHFIDWVFMAEGTVLCNASQKRIDPPR